MIKFDESYYEYVIQEYGYDPLLFEKINFQLSGFTQEDLNRQWLCHSKGDIFANKQACGESSIVTTGFGLSGTPHMGTVSQILRAIRFQSKGYDTQIVLGDLDSFNGKSTPFSLTQELVEKYKEFILQLGFKENTGSRLRSQYEELHTVRTSYLISHYLEDHMFEETEEDLHGFYQQHGKVDKEMTYRRKQSLNLMIADFIDLHLTQGYTNILVFLGIDEHKYARLAQKTTELMNEGQFSTNMNISTLYSSIIKGFNNYPKMSKSFPESGITLDMDKDTIHYRLMHEEGEYQRPEENVVYQMIASASLFNEQEIHTAYIECMNKSSKWKKIKHDYAEQLHDICKKWRN
ncbi:MULTISPECIES: hypothetical protein [Bacillus cereus group]|uniref:hypothetical protein n=1 Tax=Bacillus cereus group TaxID=86661 RepID=UPI0025A5E989|nr:hypothetical protein [Bacillus thuringiensis]MDM8365443.1 hypothetical protein [Bacillus thuringiensis]